jgi:hypothetical protein
MRLKLRVRPSRSFEHFQGEVRMKSGFFSAAAIVASTCLAALAAEPVPKRALAPIQPGIESGGPAAAKPWAESEAIFTGRLESVQAGPVGLSFPPMYTHTLRFKVDRVLRGKLESGQQLTGSHVARQTEEPVFPEGQVCLVAGSTARGSFRIERIELADPEKIRSVELAAALPLGWRLEDDQPVSPWAGLPGDGWKNSAAEPKPLRCVRSGRPALMAGPSVTLAVEHVPPVKEIQWTNPDGDGQYKVTVTNSSDQPIRIPALLTDGQRILWDESLAIICQGKAYPAPGAKGVTSAVQSAELAAGQSVSTVINALRLDGPEWPRGGYRIEFQFCLGELSQTKSFYYMSRHHDPIRAALSK